MGRPGRRRSLLVVQLFFRSFRMRVARLLLCCVLLEDYSTNLGGTAITSDAMRQDGPSSATNPTLSGTHSRTYSSAYCRLLPFAPRRRGIPPFGVNGTKNARARACQRMPGVRRRKIQERERRALLRRALSRVSFALGFLSALLSAPITRRIADYHDFCADFLLATR